MHCLNYTSWGKNEPKKKKEINKIRTQEILLVYEVDVWMVYTVTYFVGWWIWVVAGHNKEIPPPSQAATTPETLLLEIKTNEQKLFQSTKNSFRFFNIPWRIDNDFCPKK